MAIVGGTDDEELQKQNGKADAPGGEGGYVTGAAGGPTTKAGGTPTSSGGGYTNLSSYLQANQDSGGTTGKAAENVVDQSANVAGTAQNDYGSSGSKDVADAKSKVSVDQGRMDQIAGGGAKVDQNVLNQIDAGAAQADPETLASLRSGVTTDIPTLNYTGPADAKAAAYQGTAPSHVAWGGPNSASDSSGWSSDTLAKKSAAEGANDTVAKNAAAAQGGQAGVSALLKGYTDPDGKYHAGAYSQPSYTAGENNLDAFLAGGTAGGKAALGQSAGVASNTAGGYQKLNGMLNDGIAGGRKTADETNSTYDTAYNNAFGQTGAVDNIYAQHKQAAVDKSNAASDVYKAAAAQGQQYLADKKAKADEAERKRKAQLDELAKAGAFNPNPTTGDSGSGKSSPSDYFPAPGKSQDNPLIPNPIPNPVPVNPFPYLARKLKIKR